MSFLLASSSSVSLSLSLSLSLSHTHAHARTLSLVCPQLVTFKFFCSTSSSFDSSLKKQILRKKLQLVKKLACKEIYNLLNLSLEMFTTGINPLGHYWKIDSSVESQA